MDNSTDSNRVVYFSNLTGIVLTPFFTYVKKVKYKNCINYHNQQLDHTLSRKPDQATDLLKRGEFYQPTLQHDICLNAGSVCTNIMETIRGRTFAWAFYNKVVLPNTWLEIWAIKKLVQNEPTKQILPFTPKNITMVTMQK